MLSACPEPQVARQSQSECPAGDASLGRIGPFNLECRPPANVAQQTADQLRSQGWIEVCLHPAAGSWNVALALIIAIASQSFPEVVEMKALRKSCTRFAESHQNPRYIYERSGGKGF